MKYSYPLVSVLSQSLPVALKMFRVIRSYLTVKIQRVRGFPGSWRRYPGSPLNNVYACCSSGIRATCLAYRSTSLFIRFYIHLFWYNSQFIRRVYRRVLFTALYRSKTAKAQSNQFRQKTMFDQDLPYHFLYTTESYVALKPINGWWVYKLYSQNLSRIGRRVKSIVDRPCCSILARLTNTLSSWTCDYWRKRNT